MSNTLAVRLDPRVANSATTVAADWNHLPEEVVMMINNFIRKMDYDDHWGWGESIAKVGQGWGCVGYTDRVKAFLIYRYQMKTDIEHPWRLCAVRKQLLADIISVHFDRAYKHAVGSGINEIEIAWDMV